MTEHDFQMQLDYSLEARDHELFDRFYSRAFPGLDRVERVEDLARQKRGIDKVLHFQSGWKVTVDEKKRRVDYGDILLELWSVWEQRKRGWLYTSQCDYIVYAVMPASKVYVLPSLLLKRVWWIHQKWWRETGRMVEAQNKGYITRSIAVPAEELLTALRAAMEEPLRIIGGGRSFRGE